MPDIPQNDKKSKSKKIRYILCADESAAGKRLNFDFPIIGHATGAGRRDYKNKILTTPIEVRHYVYPEVLDGFQGKIDYVEVDQSAVQSLSIATIANYLFIFKLHIKETNDNISHTPPYKTVHLAGCSKKATQKAIEILRRD